jgi:hypothetical protein
VRPRLRRRWFNDLLKTAASLKCSSSRGRANPRMVKRRNSPYASHDREIPRNLHADFTPQMLKPEPLDAKLKFAILG